MPRRRAILAGHVFINCPFDEDYAPIFGAMIFAVHDCGFLARCARETEDSGETRLLKILNIIKGCALAIHDLSRVQVSEGSGLPRFNMPFELGLFLGAKYFGHNEHRVKTCLILDSESHRYQQFLSDIGGQDIRSHADDPEGAIKAIRNWLVTKPTRANMPSGSIIADRYRLFLEELPAICEAEHLKPSELEFIEYQRLVSDWVELNLLPKDAGR